MEFAVKKQIPQIISEIGKIPLATNIPKNEIQNIHPPHISIQQAGNRRNITIRKIWDGKIEQANIEPNLADKIAPTINEENIFNKISEDYNEEIWGPNEEYGLEAIAWYKSFHISNYWGIYISYSGLLRYAKKFYSVVKDENICIDLAWNGILAHEAVHFGVDVSCSKLEIITQKPIYLASKANINSTFGYSIDEERIAEGALLRYFKSKRNLHINKLFSTSSIYEIALRHSQRMPPGYSDGYQASTMLDFKRYADSYIAELVNYSVPSHHNYILENFDLSNLMPLRNTRGGYVPGYIDWTECPIYIVNDHNYTQTPGGLISFLCQIKNIQESQKFIKKISPNYTELWKKTKYKLSDPVWNKNSPSIDLKRWPLEDNKSQNTKAWSVRVGGQSSNLRAHLDEDLDSGDWTADRFGNADIMGHHKNR
jgi:hypothetical protein